MTDDLQTKACTRCREVQPLTAFSTDKRHADGRQSQCRRCTKERQKAWKEADPEHVKKLRAAEYQRRKPKAQQWAKDNAERIREWNRVRTESLTPEERQLRRERHRESSARYLERNPEMCAQRIREWRVANPEKQLDKVHRRRARKLGNGAYEEFTRRDIGDRDGWVCGICDNEIDPALVFPDWWSQSLDHVVPLVHGGEHTRANCRIAHLICNIRRGADLGS